MKSTVKKVSKHSNSPEQSFREVPSLSILPLSRKVLTNTQHVAYPQKLKQPHELTKKVFHIERLGDKTLQCRETGQKIPSTDAGVPDWEKLIDEIYLQR